MVVAGVGAVFNQSAKFRKFVGEYVPGLRRFDSSDHARLQGYEAELMDNLQSFEQIRKKVQSQLTAESETHRDRDNELLGVKSLLARFKDEYTVGMGPGGFPRQILGRSDRRSIPVARRFQTKPDFPILNLNAVAARSIESDHQGTHSAFISGCLPLGRDWCVSDT